MLTVTLSWEGPFTFRKFLTEEKRFDNSRGVYFWRDGPEPSSPVWYVGKTSGQPSLYKRQFHHYLSLIGGQYVIPQRQSNGEKWECTYEELDILLDKNRYMELVADSFEFVSCLYIYVAPLNNENKVPLRVVETNLLFDLNPKGTWKPKTEPEPCVKFVHTGAYRG